MESHGPSRRSNVNAGPTNNLTPCSGIISREMAPLFAKKTMPGNRFECPRCGTRYTRAKTVQGSFPACIRRFGNLDWLTWKNKPSCQNARVEPPRGRRVEKEKSRRKHKLEKERLQREELESEKTDVSSCHP